MILSGHQPNYWPYPGLIGKIMKSDVFMYVSNVQFEKKSWQKRNRIRTKEGWIYIQVPTVVKGKFDQKICEVEIDNRENWQKKTLNAISLLYGKSPYYEDYKSFLDDVYTRKWNKLEDIDIYITNFILKELDCHTKILYDKDYILNGKKTDMLVNMCEQTGCDTYLSNFGSSAYVDISAFIRKGLNHRYINYKGFKYQQRFQGFEPGLSILDMLMNCGREKTKEIIMDDNNYSYSNLNENYSDGEMI